MSFYSLFVNSKIENCGMLCDVADWCLAPHRYLFKGRTIQIEEKSGIGEKIHHVISFHPCGERNHSSTNPVLVSKKMQMWKTALAIAFFIPGLIVGILLKMITLFSKDSKDKYKKILVDLELKPAVGIFNIFALRLGQLFGQGLAQGITGKKEKNQTKEFYPDMEALLDESTEDRWQRKIENRVKLGSSREPITSLALNRELRNLKEKNECVDTLVIYCKQKDILTQTLQTLENNRNATCLDKILEINPMKLIVFAPKANPLSLKNTSKWEMRKALSLSSALKEEAPLRQYFPCKKMHFLYEIELNTTPQVLDTGPRKKQEKIHSLKHW